MKLNTEQLKSVTTGAVRFEETEFGLKLYRFTQEQLDFYSGDLERYIPRALCSAGVVLRFVTDSERLFVEVYIEQGSTGTGFSMEILSNRHPVGEVTNMLPEEKGDYDGVKYPLGRFSKEVELGAGEKQVEIYLPYNQITNLCELSLSEGAAFTPVKKEKKLMTWGDSITHGYYSTSPTARYPKALCDYLEAEELCKAISGEIFRSGLAALGDDYTPDYITVAYGTNDWGSGWSAENIEKACRGFAENLRKNYPDAPIFVITPVWRKDKEPERKAGSFEGVADIIKRATKGVGNLYVIEGMPLIPQREDMFGDLRLHPNNEGFAHYGKNLVEEIKKLGF
ncbi:MAG: SGNH/GDSL hydrolase family protein [Clostridia bacterium]|nr:SGNH/GDSL hydrolase family protein [Clostridia bacterium]